MRLWWILTIGLFVVASPGCSPAQPSPNVGKPTFLTAADGAQQIAELGSCKLDSGDSIADCRVGYRTYGKLNADKSNLVLWPTWFSGKTENLGFVPKDFVDPQKYFLVLVDALADGVSSAPSNSPKQPHLKFPKVTIHDMVESQRRLVREVLKVDKPITVMGISMGGMQAFEWAVSHPDEVKRFIPIVGSPQLTTEDLLLWNAELDVLDDSKAFNGGEYTTRPKMRGLEEMHWMMLSTPAARNAETPRAKFAEFQLERENDTDFDWNDWHRQLEAMIAHDVARNDGGDLAKAAKRVKAKAFIVVAAQDHMVNPAPGIAFAQAMGAPTYVSKTDCGHSAPGCDPDLPTQVRAFLASP